ncbi:MAG: glycosyltransferase, partial [Opitutae bacterium]|nr:glycosyltransferase [Opitutae bacterium]
IQGQCFKDWELLAVNDHSSDNSENIVRGYAAKDNRIQPIQSIEKGLVPALNLGVKHSAAPFVARMDADDRMLPKRLRSQVDFMEENPEVGLVSCKVEYFSSSPNDTRGYENYVDWTNKLLSHEEISVNRFVESPFAHPSVLFRKSLLDEFGPYEDGDFPEDYELWLRFLSGGVRMNKIDDVLLQWRDRPARLSRQCKRYSKDAFQRTKARYLAMWLNEHIDRGMTLTAWGAGKVARKQAAHLSREGVNIERFFDVDPKKIGTPRPGLRVSAIEDIPAPGKIFLLVLAGARSAREKITRFLEGKEYSPGKDYLFLA